MGNSNLPKNHFETNYLLNKLNVLFEMPVYDTIAALRKVTSGVTRIAELHRSSIRWFLYHCKHLASTLMKHQAERGHESRGREGNSANRREETSTESLVSVTGDSLCGHRPNQNFLNVVLRLDVHGIGITVEDSREGLY